MSTGSFFCFLGSIPILTEFKLVKLRLPDKNSVGNALTLLILTCINSLAKILPKHNCLESRKDQKKDYTERQCEATISVSMEFPLHVKILLAF